MYQSHWVRLAERVLQSLASGFVDQGEGWLTFLILDRSTMPHILDPVLALVMGVRRRENRLSIANGQAVVLTSAAEDLHGGRA